MQQESEQSSDEKVAEERLRRIIERERNARRQAEQLLEEKSRELYYTNQELKTLTSSLEVTIEQRTAELRTARDEALAASKAKSLFLANMSHEIRTPLNGILGLIDILALSELNEEQRELIDTIHTSGSHLLQIINDILDFSKIEAGKITLEYAPFHLHKEFQRWAELFRTLARKKNLEFHLEIDSAIPPIINTDGVKLSQILNNIVGNALKFTEQGNITIAVRPLASSVAFTHADMLAIDHFVIEVSDTGIGIPKDRIQHIFEDFTQADSSITRKYGGTGLGLSISKGIVTAMNGFIGIESSEGVGTSISVVLPLYVIEQKQQQSSTNSPTATSTTLSPNQIHILIADDNSINQLVTSKMLSKLGYKNVNIARNGKEAVASCKINLYSFILMDMQMPELDGLDATKIILQEHIDTYGLSVPPPVIIGCTANIAEEDKKRCFDVGMKDVLVKPFSLTDLQTYLQQHVASSP